MIKVISLLCLIHIIFQVDDELEVQVFYAGHVLGAAMFLIKVGSQSVFYTVCFKQYINTYL